jgi:hypothetical protein
MRPHCAKHLRRPGPVGYRRELHTGIVTEARFFKRYTQSHPILVLAEIRLYEPIRRHEDGACAAGYCGCFFGYCQCVNHVSIAVTIRSVWPSIATSRMSLALS